MVVGIGVVGLSIVSCCFWTGWCSIVTVGILSYFVQLATVTDLCFGPDLASHFTGKENM